MPALIVLDPPPAYLASIPSPALLATSPDPERFPGSPADRVLGALRHRGIYARPTLAEVEAERARRGLRSRVRLSGDPAPARVVLPMHDGAGPNLAALGVTRPVSEEARRNRARIAAIFGGDSVATLSTADVRDERHASRSGSRARLARIAAEVGGRVA